MNNNKKMVTLKDYIDSGVIEKMTNGFSLYDADLKNYEGEQLDLTSSFDKLHDCEIMSIIIGPNPIGFMELIVNISTTNFRTMNNLDKDDFRNMMICNGDCYTKIMSNSISLSFNDNMTVGGIINYLVNDGVNSATIKLILSIDKPVPHYANLYSYLFNSLHCSNSKIYCDEVLIKETARNFDVLVVDKVYRTPENHYLICLDLNKNKDVFNKTLLYLSEYVNKTYKTK